MTQSKIVLTERPTVPFVAPNTLVIYGRNNALYMKDDNQEVVQLGGQTIQFGDVSAGNYAEFEADGTLVFYGAAQCWRDELQPLIGSRLESPASDIVLNPAEGSVTFQADATYATDYAFTSLQLNHDWELGSQIHPHLHWWQVSSDVPNWLLGYRWQKQGSAKTTSWTNLPFNSHTYSYSEGTLNQISRCAAITPPVGYGEVSDIIQFRIYRDTTNVSTEFAGADPEDEDVDAVNFDIHIEVDTLGSRQEYSK